MVAAKQAPGGPIHLRVLRKEYKRKREAWGQILAAIRRRFKEKCLLSYMAPWHTRYSTAAVVDVGLSL